MVMYLFSLLEWWYGKGVLGQLNRQLNGLARTLDTFSFALLLRTLFSPYKQISAGAVRGPLPVQLRALVDNLFSRVIGAVFRSILIFAGGIMLAVRFLISGVILIVWILLPVLPLIGLVLTLSGVKLS